MNIVLIVAIIALTIMYITEKITDAIKEIKRR